MVLFGLNVPTGDYAECKRGLMNHPLPSAHGFPLGVRARFPCSQQTRVAALVALRLLGRGRLAPGGDRPERRSTRPSATTVGGGHRGSSHWASAPGDRAGDQRLRPAFGPGWCWRISALPTSPRVGVSNSSTQPAANFRVECKLEGDVITFLPSPLALPLPVRTIWPPQAGPLEL